MTTPCVIYCAKSTEDKHESIPGQLADCRTRATDEGWTVVGEYSDEGVSAYSASRGPGLIAAREHAAAAAAEHGTVAMLLCQHSDGISRGAGDKPGATDALVEIWHQERRRNVWLRSVDADDDDLRTTKGAASIGDRNHKDSKRKSAATRAGLQRRKERGEPVGRIPLGYRAEASIEDGKAVTRRVIDPVGAAVIRQMFDLVEEGFTFGDISRRFNDAGRARDQRRAQLDNEGRAGVRVQRGIRGRQGLPGHHRRRELAAHRRRAAQAGPRGRPAAQGRPARADAVPAEAYLVLRALRQPDVDARPGPRTRPARLSNVRGATGLCDAPPVSAEIVEARPLGHLDWFYGGLRRWVEERVAVADAERRAYAEAIAGQRAELRRLDLRAQAAYDCGAGRR